MPWYFYDKPVRHGAVMKLNNCNNGFLVTILSREMVRTFILYGSEGCHLCEDAEALLVACLNPEKHQVDLIDIAYDDRLMARFATQIPVLEDEQGDVLNWPFSAEQLRAFVG